MSKIDIIPTPATLEKIIETYKIVGDDKNALLSLKGFYEGYKDGNSYLVEMSLENFKYCTSAIATINRNNKEISALKKEIERLNNIHTVSYILMRIKQRIKKLSGK